jgi:hypothetical protein
LRAPEEREILGAGVKMKPSSRVWLAGLIGLTVAMGGCAGKSRKVAEAATQQFRDRYARSEFDQMYAATAPAFWVQTTHDDFVKLMRGLTRKLGSYRSSTEMGWNVYAGTDGTRVTLGYHSIFEKGAADERLIWQVKDGAAKLLNYNVNSPAFLAD